jgi:hypothetical protein
MPTWISNYDES